MLADLFTEPVIITSRFRRTYASLTALMICCWLTFLILFVSGKIQNQGKLWNTLSDSEIDFQNSLIIPCLHGIGNNVTLQEMNNEGSCAAPCDSGHYVCCPKSYSCVKFNVPNSEEYACQAPPSLLKCSVSNCAFVLRFFSGSHSYSGNVVTMSIFELNEMSPSFSSISSLFIFASMAIVFTFLSAITPLALRTYFKGLSYCRKFVRYCAEAYRRAEIEEEQMIRAAFMSVGHDEVIYSAVDGLPSLNEENGVVANTSVSEATASRAEKSETSLELAIVEGDRALGSINSPVPASASVSPVAIEHIATSVELPPTMPLELNTHRDRDVSGENSVSVVSAEPNRRASTLQSSICCQFSASMCCCNLERRSCDVLTHKEVLVIHLSFWVLCFICLLFFSNTFLTYYKSTMGNYKDIVNGLCFNQAGLNVIAERMSDLQIMLVMLYFLLFLALTTCFLLCLFLSNIFSSFSSCWDAMMRRVRSM